MRRLREVVERVAGACSGQGSPPPALACGERARCAGAAAGVLAPGNFEPATATSTFVLGYGRRDGRHALVPPLVQNH